MPPRLTVSTLPSSRCLLLCPCQALNTLPKSRNVNCLPCPPLVDLPIRIGWGSLAVATTRRSTHASGEDSRRRRSFRQQDSMATDQASANTARGSNDRFKRWLKLGAAILVLLGVLVTAIMLGVEHRQKKVRIIPRPGWMWWFCTQR